MNGQQRKNIRPGARVEIVLKKDQRSGKRTVGVVKDILTSSAFHARGIKVRLEDGQIGRVQTVLSDEASNSQFEIDPHPSPLPDKERECAVPSPSQGEG